MSSQALHRLICAIASSLLSCRQLSLILLLMMMWCTASLQVKRCRLGKHLVVRCSTSTYYLIT
ncbi:hypothetical protein BDR04DRAFT_1087352, partial [Suillus decipiens]